MWLVGPFLFVNRPENSQAVELHHAVAEVLRLAEGVHRTDGNMDAVFSAVADLQVAVANLKAARLTWEVRT